MSLTKLKQQLRALKDATERDPQVVDAYHVLRAARERARARVAPQIAQLESDIKAAEAAKAARVGAAIDPKVADFIRRTGVGIVGGNADVRMTHLIGTYYVFHEPGGFYWDNSGKHYVVAHHYLFDLSLDDGKEGRGTYDKARIQPAHYVKKGRFTPSDRAAWLADIAEFMTK